MKYVYAGYSKTGTKSVARAFKQLGFRVVDFEETMLFHADQWIELLTPTTPRKRQYQLLRDMYKDFDVVCDAPAYFFWKEILEVFPEAKCVFYQRKDENTWCVSMKKQYDEMSILSPLPDSIMWALRAVFNPFMNRMGVFGDKCMQLIFNDTGRPRRTWSLKWMQLNEMTLRRNYRMHNICFLAECPEDRRLVLDKLGEWEPICEFVGCDVPDVVFPHDNKGGSITADILGGKAARQSEDVNLMKVNASEIKRRTLVVMMLTACVYFLYNAYLT